MTEPQPPQQKKLPCAISAEFNMDGSVSIFVNGVVAKVWKPEDPEYQKLKVFLASLAFPS